MIAIVCSYWMHYKDLLFKSLTGKHVDFVAIFSALGSSQRAIPTPSETYNYRALHNGNYEERPPAKTAYRVWQTLNSLRPSTVVIEGWYDTSCWAAWLWANLHKVPIILWAESNDFDKPRSRVAESAKKLFASRASCSHVYGKSNRDYLLNLGLSKDLIVLDRAVINTESLLLGRPTFETSNLNFLYVGRFAPEKNLEHLLSSFSMFLHQAGKAHTLTLVGNGQLEPA